ncbi:MAG: hypothetical protein KBF96_07905, partial [Ignavibacteria bacterium]|nr:hypothetical protein [Ignavibacteria bacterium]
MKRSIYFFLLFSILHVLVTSGNFLQAQSDIVPLDRKLKGPDINTTSEIRPPENNSDAIIINVPGSYSTIQAAINAANNGDIIQVAAGIYREDLTLNKYLHLRGSNYNVNPNTGIRGPETIIQPFTSDPDPNTGGTILYITPGGSGSDIDGFTFDGDNTIIVSGVNMNGADVDALEAISAYDGLSNTTVSNNIIKNLNYGGIDYYNYTNGGAATYDNVITNNKFDNIIPNAWGIAVLIYNNCYTSVTDNVMTRVRIGVQTGNFSQTDLGTNHSISHNNIESSRLGIFHNLAYTNATTYTIDSNNITTVVGSTNNNGILVSSFDGAVAVNMNDNNVSDARVGYNLWNCPTTSTITVTGGTATNCNIGVFANNYDGYTSDAVTSIYAMTGVTIANCDTAIKIKDNDLNSNNATVALNINNTTNIVNGTGIGLLLEGGDASVIFNGAVPVDFSTSLAKYIRLATNGTTVPSALINAQSVRFGGTNGTALSNAQLFAVEDKIDHKVDWNSLGFVSVKAFNNYVTTNSFYPPNTAAGLIQSGIDVATPGDTVNAGSGTFNENVLLNKSVTLKGNGTSSTIIAPLVSCTGNGLTISSPNVNVSDLRVTDFNYGIFTSSTSTNLYNVESVMNCNYGINTGNGTNGLTMVKCKFNNNTNGGWRAGTGDLVSNVTMDSCEVKNHTN